MVEDTGGRNVGVYFVLESVLVVGVVPYMLELLLPWVEVVEVKVYKLVVMVAVLNLGMSLWGYMAGYIEDLVAELVTS